MPSKPVTYVRRITNLSDARYCAGMGVDMLGYIVDPTHPDYVSPKLYQEISGWIAGPKRVIEVGIDHVNLDEIFNDYSPELVHVRSLTTTPPARLRDFPIILEVDPATHATALQTVKSLGLKLEFLLVTGVANGSFSPGFRPWLLEVGDASSVAMLRGQGADGFAMRGSREAAPGLKDYDHLSAILEELDSD
jgi:phosphoribosylanthranilate isomerase